MVLGKSGVRDGEGRVWEEAPGPQGSHGTISWYSLGNASVAYGPKTSVGPW